MQLVAGLLSGYTLASDVCTRMDAPTKHPRVDALGVHHAPQGGDHLRGRGEVPPTMLDYCTVQVQIQYRTSQHARARRRECGRDHAAEGGDHLRGVTTLCRSPATDPTAPAPHALTGRRK